MKDFLIYVVEDNKIYNHLVTEYLKKKNFNNVRSFFSGNDCISAIEKGENPDIVVQDYHMEGLNGIDVLKKVKKLSPESEFVFLTANESIEVAVNVIKFGAYDYVVKDEVALDKVTDKIKKIIKLKKLEHKNEQIRKYMIASMIVLILIVLVSVGYYFIQR